MHNSVLRPAPATTSDEGEQLVSVNHYLSAHSRCALLKHQLGILQNYHGCSCLLQMGACLLEFLKCLTQLLGQIPAPILVGECASESLFPFVLFYVLL